MRPGVLMTIPLDPKTAQELIKAAMRQKHAPGNTMSSPGRSARTCTQFRSPGSPSPRGPLRLRP
ncbi:protein of unknown function [Hyphomicrobium sp. MC1]|nr:protein of unknown function [Hyphomicrobium sp. MC1]